MTDNESLRCEYERLARSPGFVELLITCGRIGHMLQPDTIPPPSPATTPARRERPKVAKCAGFECVTGRTAPNSNSLHNDAYCLAENHRCSLCDQRRDAHPCRMCHEIPILASEANALYEENERLRAELYAAEHSLRLPHHWCKVAFCAMSDRAETAERDLAAAREEIARLTEGAGHCPLCSQLTTDGNPHCIPRREHEAALAAWRRKYGERKKHIRAANKGAQILSQVAQLQAATANRHYQDLNEVRRHRDELRRELTELRDKYVKLSDAHTRVMGPLDPQEGREREFARGYVEGLDYAVRFVGAFYLATNAATALRKVADRSQQSEQDRLRDMEDSK